VKKPLVILVVLLALVVVLFVVATGVGVGKDAAEPADGDHPLVAALTGLAQRSSDAALADLSADCPDLAEHRLVFSGTCNLSVAPLSDRLRVVRLQTDSGLEVTAAAPQGDVDDISSDVDAGDDVTVAVGTAGAGGAGGKRPVSLRCRKVVGTCTVRVLNP
jgi:hypothetical protein